MGRPKIGYAAMLEQFHPTDLLDWCAQAETAGFSAGFMVSEHFHPWTPAQGQSAFAWSFMGALGQRTSLPFGTAVTCPGFRYHPAVIAHDMRTFALAYALAIAVAFVPGDLRWPRLLVAALLVAIYLRYVRGHFREDDEAAGEGPEVAAERISE